MVAVSGTTVTRSGPSTGDEWRPGRIGVQRHVRVVDLRGHAVATRPPVRLPASTYRRRRAVAAGLAVVLVLAVFAALGMLGGGPLAASERPTSSFAPPATGATYVVQPGDTLWSIAHRLRPSADPRPLVDRLVTLHGGATLYVGERITLPPA